MELNTEQRAIVQLPADAKVKVLAGAGTGKTRALTERYLKFVFEDRVSPDRLLALTFTKKAAAEMYQRVFEGALKRGDETDMRRIYGAWIMNFHQFSYRVIRENAPAFGVDPAFGVASEVDVERVKRALFRRFEGGRVEGLPDDYGDDLPPPNDLRGYFERCLKIVDTARGGLWTPASLLATLRERDMDVYRRYVQTVTALWRGFEQELRARRLFDFNDLVRVVVAAFQSDERFRAAYADRFDHILVDEFQDTSEAQNELLRLLAGDGFSRVTVVGDDKQSIYRWRDARVEHLREFPGDALYLRQNYRSTQVILDAAFRLIVEDPYFAANADNIRLDAAAGDADVPISLFHPSDDEGLSPAAEARALGAWILALTGELETADVPFAQYRDRSPRLPLDRIAVLMRSLKPSSGLPEYERELQRLRIPYAILGGVSALESQVMERFKSLLRLLVEPGDVTAFLSVVESRPFYANDATLNELFAGEGRRFTLDVFLDGRRLDALTDREAAERLQTLRSLVDELETRRSRLDLAGFVIDALELTPFLIDLFGEGADLRIVDSVSKRLLEIIGQLEARGEANLGAFVESIDTLLKRKQFGEEDAPYVPAGRVVIMTLHQAKGLEFDAVALPGIKSSAARGDGFLLVEGEGLLTNHPETPDRSVNDRPERDAERREHEQEERCLLYVGMTRAKRHLLMTTPHPGGLERGDKPNYFASVLDGVRRYDLPHETVRTVGELPARRGPNVGTEVVGRPVAPIDRWDANRSRIEAARVLERPVQQPLRFATWRALAAFARCPLEYHYRFVARVEDEVALDDHGVSATAAAADAVDGGPASLSPAEFGTFVHRFLFEWLDPAASARRDARELASSLARRAELGGKVREEAVRRTVELAAAYAKVADDAGVAQREWPIRRRCGDVVFHGVLDRVDDIDGRYRVVDYKVGRESPDYAFQVRYYSWLLDGVKRGRVTDGRIWFFTTPPSSSEVAVAATDLEHIASHAREFAAAVQSADYPAHPGRVCRECDYREICPFTAT